MNIETFTKMVKSHDLTFMYSDDAYVRERGYDNLAKIREAAKLFSIEEAREIWNANVDRIMVDGYRKEFYW